MSSVAVIGLGFGDEGKGITIDYLARRTYDPLVVRYCGGQQAGHTVVTADKRHVFSNFGSGTLDGAPTYWSKYCTIDPIGIVNELNDLRQKGFDPELYIDERCPVTTPYDMYHNQHDQLNISHGSVGVGYGATIAREEAHYHLTFGDLFNSFVGANKLGQIALYYMKQKNVPALSLVRFMECVGTITNYKKIKSCYGIPNAGNRNNDYIFEGAQGLMLDQNIGFFPNVTRSNTGTTNITDMGIYPSLYLVTRAYQTRHGSGAMSNDDIVHSIYHDPNETNVKHDYQGAFRRSLLDVDLLEYAMSKDSWIRQCPSNMKTLVITCLDHIKKDGYRFTHKGKIIECGNEMSFVDALSKRLGIKKVLISSSSISENINEFQF